MSLEIEKDAKSQDVKVKSKKCGNPCVHIIRAQENYKHWKEEKYEKHCMDEESNCYKLSETKCCKCCCCVCCGCCNAGRSNLSLVPNTAVIFLLTRTNFSFSHLFFF